MKYVIQGDVPRQLVERIIEKSHEKNCSVGAMVTGQVRLLIGNWPFIPRGRQVAV